MLYNYNPAISEPELRASRGALSAPASTSGKATAEILALLAPATSAIGQACTARTVARGDWARIISELTRAQSLAMLGDDNA